MVGFNYVWFAFVLGLWCLPITVIELIIKMMWSTSEANHWKQAADVLITIAWMPFAFSKASTMTGTFQEEQEGEEKVKMAEPKVL